MIKEGEVSIFSLISLGSGAKAELGAVSLCAVVVVHAEPTPVQNTDQPGPNAGAVTPSKFCVNGVLAMPIWKEAPTVPKLFVPSLSCRHAAKVTTQANTS